MCIRNRGRRAVTLFTTRFVVCGDTEKGCHRRSPYIVTVADAAQVRGGGLFAKNLHASVRPTHSLSALPPLRLSRHALLHTVRLYTSSLLKQYRRVLNGCVLIIIFDRGECQIIRIFTKESSRIKIFIYRYLKE